MQPFYFHFGDLRSHVYTMERQYTTHFTRLDVCAQEDLQIIRHHPTLLLVSETACTVI